jgi:hypothetical protein
MKNSDTNGADGTGAPAGLPRSLQIFLGVAVTLLMVAGIVETICRYYLHFGPPYNSPLLSEHFADLLTLRPRFQNLHTLLFFTDINDPPYMYPAPVAICYRVFFSFAPYELGVFLSFVVLCFVVAAILFGRELIRRNLSRTATILLLGISLVTSFPLWFELKQANMEICSWVLLAVGLWAFLRGRGYTSAACFGIAGAMKITPFFYLGLFLARRQYRHILFALLSAAAVTVPSLWMIYPHIGDSWRLTNLAVSKFRTVVTLHIYPHLAFDHSLFGVIKKVAFKHLSYHQLSHLLTMYSIIAALCMLLVFFLWVRKLPVINQVICLCVATLILPPTSFDYTLLSLYLPWAMLVLLAVHRGNRDQDVPGLVLAMVCFAILFVPETEIILHRRSIAGQLKALTLVALFFIALRYPFHSSNSPEWLDDPMKLRTNPRGVELTRAT